MCRTYYVSANRGNHNHSGSSPKEAFASLAAINRLELGPGDRVLLECGSVFENQYLHLSARGTEEKPVVLMMEVVWKNASRQLSPKLLYV